MAETQTKNPSLNVKCIEGAASFLHNSIPKLMSQKDSENLKKIMGDVYVDFRVILENANKDTLVNILEREQHIIQLIEKTAQKFEEDPSDPAVFSDFYKTMKSYIELQMPLYVKEKNITLTDEDRQGLDQGKEIIEQSALNGKGYETLMKKVLA